MRVTIEQAAGICHEVNRIWCEANGDFSQPTWSEAPRHVRKSAENGVHFRLQNPTAPNRASHDNWMQFKLMEGWTAGPIKDYAKKTHPNLVPWESLPPEEQVKDGLFSRVVHVLRPFITD